MYVSKDEFDGVVNDLIADGSLSVKDVSAAQRFIYELWNALPVDAEMDFSDFLMYMDDLGY